SLRLLEEIRQFGTIRLVLKWHTRSSNPSPFTSSPFPLQNARLFSSPVRPNVSELWSTVPGASKSLLDRSATGTLPLLLGLIGFGNSPGRISIFTKKPKISHSTELRGEACHRSAKASGGEDLQVEEPVTCGDGASLNFHATLAGMLGSTLI